MTGGVAILVIPIWGWRSTLLIGFLPIFFLPVLLKWCPESVRFLAEKNRIDEAIKTMRRMETSAGVSPIAWERQHFVFGAGPAKANFTDIFKGGLATMTILLWFAYFFNLLVTYGLSTMRL